MKEEFMGFQKDNATLRTEVSELQEDVQSISSQQGEISLQVGGVEQAVVELGKQLTAMSTVLQSIVPQISANNQKQVNESTSQTVNSPALQQ